MANVLITFESYEPTNQETFKAFSIIQSKGYINLRSKRCIDIKADDLDWCDIVYSIRSTSSLEASLSTYAKKLGKYWMMLLDDDFLSLGKNYGQDGQGYREERKKALKKVLMNTDCLLTANDNLTEKYAKYGNYKRTYKGETAVELDKLVTPQAASDRVKIVYYVNDGTTTMIDRYLKPVFKRLAEKYPGRISLFFMAVQPDLHELDKSLDIHYVPHMGFDEFLKYIADQHFDIGLAPLDDNGFSKFKYINKFVEYTRAGVAGIYSNCELYKSVIKDRENGLICDNTTDGWMNALSDLIEDDKLKVSIAKGAQTYIRENMSTEAVINSIITAIPELKEYKAPARKASQIVLILFHLEYWCFRIRGWIFTAYNSIRTGNLKGLFRRAARKIRREG